MDTIKVLYLEDEESLGKITNDMLVKNGFSVQWILDGRKGLEVFKAKIFDICIVDIMMPGLDGYSFVKEIRKTDPNIPVIFLTARSLTEDVVKGFEIGGNDYLKKPFSIEELIIRMKALLNRVTVSKSEPQAQTTFQIGKYVFDHSSMELSSGEKKTVLTHLENELILQLILNKNNVLQRQRVLQDLWGDDTFFNARSMDVFITKIRKHFADDDAISIVNIRGIGYKMIVKEGL
ncbi:DNA-binding response OmpR family regulator [Flavobacterium endophyticum]|uniref:DNA-binding response OmpR family regulator n=1 Tax=Flavobacterium endophyticum TaxID=1540163 RepID=A0A495LZP1_9FLAO|nr:MULTISPECIES: response regulator transcription factor [Flavobacterium]RKS19164.1 DNA-binding response OmpR family regulator [Flavobacterium endophyticum]WDO11492.1 response regulator transcription factor [Flavobacterium sp. WW92]